MVGETIGHYRILDKIGEGGMGVVYRAEDTLLLRTVALKFLSEAALTNEKHRARFLREAQAAGSLDHPNICTVHGIEEHGREMFIVMAFLPGETLHQRVRRGPLPLASALDYAIQIGSGLQEAHGRGVIHRDVKSANIILTPEGKAVITDFGLALLAERSRITDAGTTLGTVAYMSPEQALAEDVDHRTDIWSLGVVLYEMIARRYPFQGNTAHEICRSILTEMPYPVIAARKKAPHAICCALERALAKRREDRYSEMREFLEVLGSLRAKLPSEKPEDLAGIPGGPPPDTDAPTETLHDGHAITIETAVREKVRDSARPSGPQPTSRLGVVAANWWKPALVVLAVVVIVGMILIWMRAV